MVKERHIKNSKMYQHVKAKVIELCKRDGFVTSKTLTPCAEHLFREGGARDWLRDFEEDGILELAERREHGLKVYKLKADE